MTALKTACSTLPALKTWIAQSGELGAGSQTRRIPKTYNLTNLKLLRQTACDWAGLTLVAFSSIFEHGN
jgi:hypothetical protein